MGEKLAVLMTNTMKTKVTDKHGVDLFGKKIVTVEFANGSCIKTSEKDPVLKKLAVGREVDITYTAMHSEAFTTSSGRIFSSVVLDGANFENIEPSPAESKFKDLADDTTEIEFRNIEELSAAKKARETSDTTGAGPSADAMGALASALSKGPQS